MRRMFSQKQIERMAKEIADTEISDVLNGETFVGFGNSGGIFTASDDGYVGILTTTQADEGKVVGVNEDGEPTLVEVSGGTKLYRHDIRIEDAQSQDQVSFYVVSSDAVECYDGDEVDSLIANGMSSCLIVEGPAGNVGFYDYDDSALYIHSVSASGLSFIHKYPLNTSDTTVISDNVTSL